MVARKLHHDDINLGDAVRIQSTADEGEFSGLDVEGNIDDFKISANHTSLISQLNVNFEYDGVEYVGNIKTFMSDAPRGGEMDLYCDSKLYHSGIPVEFELL